MSSTKRSQNKCNSCGYTWYPRGKDKSLKCPNCGGNRVSITGGGGLILGLIFVGWLVFGNREKPTEPSRPQVSVPSAIELGAERPVATSEFLPPKAHEATTVDRPSESVAPISSDLENTEHTESTTQSPSENCKDESNIFSRNNCMWRECEKLQFVGLKDCENRKPKTPANFE